MNNIKSDKKQQQKNRIIRLTILIFFLLLSTILGILHQIIPHGKAPVGVDALCPFGAIESAYTLINTGKLIQRIEISSFIIFFIILIIAVLFRRAFCGYICPLGTLQELASIAGRKIIKQNSAIPNTVDHFARYIKYAILVITVVFSARTAELIIRPYDPWAAYQHLTSNELFLEFSIGFAILILSLIGSFFYNRVFCKYLCPMGAFLAIISPISWMKVRRNSETCIQCKACTKVCPVNIDVSSAKTISSPECIDCGECVNVCPVKDTLNFGSNKGKIISAGTVLITVILIFITGIISTTITKNFNWKTIPLTEQINASTKFDPDLIRGKMTLQEIIESSGIAKKSIVERFKITDEKDLNIPMKNLKDKYGFDTDDVRDYMQKILNQ